ncbi:MAG: DUF4402 domain-containing protein [Planctomycetota bacterium]|jgi:hypothetical protein
MGETDMKAMNLFKFAAVIMGSVGLAALGTSQAWAASANSNADAEVVAPIGISNTTGMNFGRVSPTGVAGTVVLDTAGSRTATNVDLLSGGTVAAAAFAVTGGATLTHDAGGAPALDGTGNDSFNVGATLNVGAAQAAGSYTGTFSVTADYN